MPKETETEETINAFVIFSSLVLFQLEGPDFQRTPLATPMDHDALPSIYIRIIIELLYFYHIT